MSTPAAADVVPLTELGRDSLPIAGGKGANLGELVRTGAPVPAGFVVTTAAYVDLIARTRIADRIGERLALVPPDSGEPDGATVREEFETAEVPEALRRSIVEAYDRLGGGPVAVRSSATAEDLPGAAFA
ncbi:MAG: PEP/pyruvate-binding domain-containing protein, partial [Stackebrandtia sp.]